MFRTEPLDPLRLCIVRRLGLCLCLCVTLLAASAARAQLGSDPLSDLISEPSSAALGFVTRVERSPYVGGGTRTDLLPLYLYEGERFFLRANRLGLNLVSADTERLDVFLHRRLEGFPEDDVPSGLVGMEYRNVGVDFGFSYRHKLPWATLFGAIAQDVSGTSQGGEINLGLFHDWQHGRLLLRPSASVSWRSAKLNDYYYGVRPAEATADRPAYAPGAGVNTSLGLYASVAVSTGWQLLGSASVTALSRNVRDSPVVNDRVVPALSVGAVYDFGSHQRQADQAATPVYVRALYGRAAVDDCHLVRILTLRCLDIEQDIPSTIGGVHFGRQFVERANDWPLDFVGYGGLIYRRDQPQQPDGVQLDLFMKAFWYGLPWNDRVKTRLGWGFGISMATRVPYIEVVKQAERGRPTSRVLNYLDPSIDFSLGDLIGSKSLKNTYLGFGVSHRSGIFGASRLLGNVDGGSNYPFIYLETQL